MLSEGKRDRKGGTGGMLGNWWTATLVWWILDTW